MGTYTWSVVRNESDGGAPLLRYAISTTYLPVEEVRVHPFTTPHAIFSCTSPLASLITHYRRLVQMRVHTEVTFGPPF